MSSLSDRIALVLQAEAASEAIGAIVDEARDEISDIEEACAAAKARMLDPASGSASVAKAKREMEDFSLQASRLAAAIERLTDHLEAARAREAEAARQQRYDEALTERDVLAKEIREKYPAAATTIAALLHRIEASDLKIEAVNSDLPDNATWLEPVEMVARGRPPNEGSPLSRSIRLPALLHQETYWNSFWPAGKQ